MDFCDSFLGPTLEYRQQIGSQLQPILMTTVSQPEFLTNQFDSTKVCCSSNFWFYVSVCAITECSANSESACINNVKTVVENGEETQVACVNNVFGDWSACPASCKTRPVSKRFRYSSLKNSEIQF